MFLTSSSAPLHLFHTVLAKQASCSSTWSVSSSIWNTLHWDCHMMSFFTSFSFLLKCHLSTVTEMCLTSNILSSLLNSAYHCVICLLSLSHVDRNLVCLTSVTPTMCQPHNRHLINMCEYENEWIPKRMKCTLWSYVHVNRRMLDN